MLEMLKERPVKELVETVYSNEKTFDGTAISVSLDVIRGVYSNGYETKPYLSLKLSRARDDRENVLFIRLNEHEQTELDWLAAVLSQASTSGYDKSLKKHVVAWEDKIKAEKAERIREHEEFVKRKIADSNRDTKVGQGLGKFSRQGKTDRKKERATKECSSNSR